MHQNIPPIVFHEIGAFVELRRLLVACYEIQKMTSCTTSSGTGHGLVLVLVVVSF